METKPPEKYEKIRHHWLFSERASFPSIAYWDQKLRSWIPINERSAVTPEEMYERGWQWYAPCLPPLSPYKESELIEGVELHEC